MIARGNGKIIFICSPRSRASRCTGYAASKGGVGQLVKALANEWAPKGVNVNGIASGLHRDRQHGGAPRRSGSFRQILDRIPPDAGRGFGHRRRGGILASHLSNYVHGAIIPVDGGWLAR